MTFNGVGFNHSLKIKISGLSFSRCGTISSGLYFNNTANIHISDCSFHHNVDSGLEIVNGNSITVVNCRFYFNVGMQPDDPSYLLPSPLRVSRGAGLSLIFDQAHTKFVTLIGCNFTNNIAYKNSEYTPLNDFRPYSNIPFGNGGAICLYLYKTSNVHVHVSNGKFYNNTTIHQGGGIVMLLFDSARNSLKISQCEFIGNKALGEALRSYSKTVNITD